jgi:outer membrane protein OmpA-like peptidoglycan-associated protein
LQFLMRLNSLQISITPTPCFHRLLLCFSLLLFQQNIFAGEKIPGFHANTINSVPDTFPKTLDSTAIIPFEYKQSTLNYASTFRLMDSVAEILNGDTAITFSVFGYSHFDEGNDYVCYWLSYNRALAVKSYLVGRGADSLRLRIMEARNKYRSLKPVYKEEPVYYNHTAEIILHYPIPPPPVIINDMDGDGIADEKDSCVNEFGYPELNGCPDRDAIIVPFSDGSSALTRAGYRVMDSVINLLRRDPSLSVNIDGHAYRTEGVRKFCNRIAIERADIVKRYILTRQIDSTRIITIKSFSNTRPLNAGRNPRDIARNFRAELHLVRKAE